MRLEVFSSLSISLFSLWVSSAQAKGDTEAEVCFGACENALQPVHFDDMLWNQTGLNKTCHSLRAMTSLYLCLEIYCMPKAREVGLRPLNQTCQDRTDTGIPPFSFISNYTSKDIAKIRRVERDETTKSLTFYEVVLPSEKFFKLWWDTLVCSPSCLDIHLV